MKLSVVETLAAMLVAVCISQGQSTQVGSTSALSASPKPLLLEKNEGEQRTWRPEPGETAYLGTSLGQDEIVFVQRGTLHARLGDQERDLHAGGMAFIPAYTWVSLKNNGTELASMVFIFSAPGFEDHLRCESVPANEKPTPISRAEENECDHLGHVVYKDRGEEDPKK
jgi:quercetin dioxygenase-like cupin family protein